MLNGKSILEFGPGSGHNALYTASLNPETYILVDGNKRGILECKSNLQAACVEVQRLIFLQSLIQDFHIKETFDIVIAEGCIPYQIDPVSILSHVSSFVEDGGALLITSVSAVGFLSEIIRRLARDVFMKPNEDINIQLDVLKPLFEPHLKTLKSMSRPIDDWILDNIVQPYHKVKLLSIPDTISALNTKFDVLGTSPKFITDWRWYKDITGKDRGFNEIAIGNYYRNNLKFLDYRFAFPQHSREFGFELEAKCGEAWDLMCKLESGKLKRWDAIWKLLDEITKLIQSLAPETAKAINEASLWIQDGVPAERDLKNFPRWWGHGQQYLSFIRR